MAIELPHWLPEQMVLPALVGSACALGLIIAIVVVRALRPKPPTRHYDGPPKPFSLDTTPTPQFDPFMAGSASEKRETFRRKGNAVRVLIRGPGKENEPIVGHVLDRSSGGIALCAPKEFPSGTILHVRPDSHFENGVWAKLEVRSVRRDRNDWHLGCKFIESLPWSVLLQFG